MFNGLYSCCYLMHGDSDVCLITTVLNVSGKKNEGGWGTLNFLTHVTINSLYFLHGKIG